VSTDAPGLSGRTDVEATITSGRLLGYSEHGINAFLGIPYAESPYGDRRFLPPEPRRPWSGVRDARSVAVGCPQPTLPQEDLALGAFINPVSTGDDCLTLNVWSPRHGAASLPVMVWIHGGGFIAGSGAAAVHSGATWARDGVVYVSINYRLHVDGFMYFDRDTSNLGLQDQVAALRWVRDNIAEFGGDPDNVTVFGQSAGAVSTAHLLSAPSAAGLFHRAIVQSGTTEGALSIDDATEITDRMAQLLGVKATPEGFAEVPHGAMLMAVSNLAIMYLSPALWGSLSFSISPFRPVQGGAVLPDPVLTALSAGCSAGVDLMVGTTHTEMTFLMQPTGLLPDPPPEWIAYALSAFGVTEAWLASYRSEICPEASLGVTLASVWSDWAFTMPSIHLAEVHSRRTPSTYLYDFSWASPSIPDFGAGHALDIPFSADVIAEFQAAHVSAVSPLGDTPPQALADEMHGAFIRFAREGDPGWGSYDEQHRTTKIFDAPCRVVDDPQGARRAMWSGIR
jgi:para-nitrobenzyl esterase